MVHLPHNQLIRSVLILDRRNMLLQMESKCNSANLILLICCILLARLICCTFLLPVLQPLQCSASGGFYFTTCHGTNSPLLSWHDFTASVLSKFSPDPPFLPFFVPVRVNGILETLTRRTLWTATSLFALLPHNCKHTIRPSSMWSMFRPHHIQDRSDQGPALFRGSLLSFSGFVL
ncbi:hypothetical protein BJ742DRAFT_801228 [Cladochytrium replicatum]|nr:hypothetical protein BJ742DRAFT_801228 [Cladochytrium replicatum]